MLFRSFELISRDTHPDTAGVSLKTLPLLTYQEVIALL